MNHTVGLHYDPISYLNFRHRRNGLVQWQNKHVGVSRDESIENRVFSQRSFIFIVQRNKNTIGCARNLVGIGQQHQLGDMTEIPRRFIRLTRATLLRFNTAPCTSNISFRRSNTSTVRCISVFKRRCTSTSGFRFDRYVFIRYKYNLSRHITYASQL